MARAALMGVVALLLVAGGAAAQERRTRPQTRKVEVLRPWAFERLDEAQRALAEERYGEALAALDEMSRNGAKLNSHERAVMWQTYGYVQSAGAQYRRAAESFEKCLATEGLPQQAVQGARYNLAQLYLVIEDYGRAIDNLLLWFESADNPAPAAHYMLATAYALAEQPKKALPHAAQAVDGAEQPKKAWLELLLSLQLEERQYRAAAAVLRQLVARFANKTYWLQLSSVYAEMGEHRNALAVQELAYEQGLLNERREIVYLARLYLYNDIPYAAGRVLEKGLAGGAIPGDAEEWKLLANSWLQARELERAVAPLERAAELSEDGNLYVQLSQLQLDKEEWEEARRALGAALGKGELRDPGTAQLLLGIASAGDARYEEAARAFAAAQKYEKTRSSATQWLEHLEAEKELDAQYTQVGGDGEMWWIPRAGNP